jgi:hypothetical protein
MGTQQAVSFHWKNTAEDETGMTQICMTSSAAEMHATGLKTSARSMSALNRSSVKKGTMTTTIPNMTNHTNSVHSRGGGQCRGSQGFFYVMKRVRWPLNFKPSGIEEYDGSTTQPSGLRCISLPSKPLVRTCTSWQIICQSAYRHPPGPGSSGFPWGHFIPGATYVGCSPVTSTPHAHIWELTGT